MLLTRVIGPKRRIDLLQAERIFEVPELESSRVLLEQRDRVDAADVCPPDVELHRDQRWIGVLDQHFIGRAWAVDELLELVGVVVTSISMPNFCAMRPFALSVAARCLTASSFSGGAYGPNASASVNEL